MKLIFSKKLYLLITIFMYSLCFSSTNDNDTYYLWESGIDSAIEVYKAKEVKGKISEDIIDYSKKINIYIIQENIDELLNNMSKDSVRFYIPKKGMSENYSKIIRKEFHERKGFYYKLFFRNGDLINKTVNKEYRVKIWSVRTYLSLYNNKLRWKVLYIPKKDAYECWFSIPDDLIYEFGYFHYRIKKINNRYLIIGF